MINVFQPALGEEELAAVGEVFQSNWIGRGRRTEEFEARFAEHVGVPRDRITSVSCCTEGMFQAVELLGIGEGDEVVLPTISFVGAANAVAARGARPVFCDVDRRTLNPTASDIAAKITERTRAVLLLHYGGVPCAMDEIGASLREKRIALIEDCACSVASSFKDQACGTFGDVGVWSFDAMKILVTGDGGMICCRTPELAERAQRSVYLGLLEGSGFTRKVDARWWEFEIDGFGRRAIMNDVSSAIGLVQLGKLPGFIQRRREVHAYYDRALEGLDWLQLPPPLPPGACSSYYFYWVQSDPDVRDRLAWHLRERGIYTTFRYYPLHQVAHYNARESLPKAEVAAATTLCLPMHQSLDDQDLATIVHAIHDFSP